MRLRDISNLKELRYETVVTLDNWAHFLMPSLPGPLRMLCDYRDSLENGVPYKEIEANK